MPLEPLTDSVNELFYIIYYEQPSILDVVNYIHSNTTEKSIAIFLEELFSSYIRLLCIFIDSLSDEDIKKALNNSNSEFEYVFLSQEEEKKLSTNIKNISGHKVIYGVYELRYKVSKIENIYFDYYYYIDNTILDYFVVTLGEGRKSQKPLDPNRLNYFRDIYQKLFKIYTENIKDHELSNFFLSTLSAPISYAKSIKVKQLLYEITYNDISIYEVIDFIEKNTSERTYDLFCNELYLVYRHYELEYMFSISDKQLEEAVNYFRDSLVYIYVDKFSYRKVKHFTKKICGIDAIFNIKGFSNTRESEDEIKFIDLNDLALRYFVGGFLGEKIEGFEKIQFLKKAVKYIWEINTKKNKVTIKKKSEQDNTDLATKKNKEQPETTSESKLPQNEAPTVFKNDYAFAVFMECYESFYHQGKSELADFSFVFHQMKKDGLIHYDVKQLSYIDFIASKGIVLDRLKPFKNIGNLEYKEEIYNSNRNKIHDDNVS